MAGGFDLVGLVVDHVDADLIGAQAQLALGDDDVAGISAGFAFDVREKGIGGDIDRFVGIVLAKIAAAWSLQMRAPPS